MSGASNERCEEVHSVDPRRSDCQQIDKGLDWLPLKRAHHSSVPNYVRTDGLDVKQGASQLQSGPPRVDRSQFRKTVDCWIAPRIKTAFRRVFEILRTAVSASGRERCRRLAICSFAAGSFTAARKSGLPKSTWKRRNVGRFHRRRDRRLAAPSRPTCRWIRQATNTRIMCVDKGNFLIGSDECGF